MRWPAAFLHLRTGILAVAVWGCVAANAGISKPIKDVIPVPGSLGPGWESRIEVLVDSETTPLQVLVQDGFLEATVKEWRRSAADPKEPLSGWAHVQFEFRSDATTNRYYLRAERLRSQVTLTNRWAVLAQASPGRHDTPLRDIGEAAFVVRDKGSIALWFRRGAFIVNVSSFGATPAGDPAGSMRHLARMADDNISGTTHSR